MTLTSADLVTDLMEQAPSDGLWAVTGRGGGSTWQELRGEVAALARLYHSHGIRPGDRVSVQMQPSLTLVWTLLALWSSDVKVLLLEVPSRDTAGVLSRWQPRFHIRSGGFGYSCARFVRDCEVILSRRPRSGEAWPTDACLVQLTADGRMAGRTAAELQAELARLSVQPAVPQAGDQVWLTASLSSPAWLVTGVLHAIRCGATLVLAADWPGLLTTELACRIGVVFTTVADARRLAESPDLSLPALRLAVVGDGPPEPDLGLEFADRFGTRLGTAYSRAGCGLLAWDPWGSHAAPAVGPVVDGVRLRSTAGELEVLADRWPYLDEPALAAAAGGCWVPTGVRGWIDSADVLSLGQPHRRAPELVRQGRAGGSG